MSLFDSFDIRDLAKVLKECDPDRREDDSTDDENCSHKGPSDIGRERKEEGNQDLSKNQKKYNATKITTPGKVSSSQLLIAESKNNIWSPEELKSKYGAGDEDEVGLLDVSNDARKVPVYEMYYSQSVTPENVFLQLGHKTPASASCENLIVKISLPGENYKSIQLDLKKQRVELRSPLYILILPTPQPVDPKAGNAKWDNEKETLTLTLKLQRELDMLNF